MKTTTDLIAQKTGEYDKLPGLLLGLDGWILRSLPADYRKQFLQGYERLLRIVFHPDRYTDPATKLSRQNYLQAVTEAVEFMGRDEFSFELASDAVPTHRSPFVMLKDALSARDSLLETTGAALDAARDQLDKLSKLEQELRSRLDNATDESESNRRRHNRMRAIVATMSRSYPVPLGARFHAVRGSFFELPVQLPKCGEEVPDLDLFHYLERYSSGDHHCGESKWFNDNKYLESFAPYLQDESHLRFDRRVAKHSRWSIAGATTVAHLCEFLRVQRGKFKGSDGLHKSLAVLTNQENLGLSAWRQETAEYMLPFYVPGTLLLLFKHKAGSDDTVLEHTALRLFMVQHSDFSQAPEKAIAAGFKNQMQELHKENLELKIKHREELGKRSVVIRRQKIKIEKLKARLDMLHKARERKERKECKALAAKTKKAKDPQGP